jgi:hypothetical protein
MYIANDFPSFKSLFIDGLKNMLADDQLGAFILVLANSMQDEELRRSLSPALQKNFSALRERYLSGQLQATPDDRDVFEKLLAMDLDKGMAGLPVWQSHDIGRWRAVVNPMRSLRPPRASNEIRSSIYADFDPGTFNFNKPFLKPEILWQGEYAGSTVRALYNKFPFVAYHTIVVIEPDEQKPQVIDQATHEYVWSLVEDAGSSIPGFGLGFNSLAAGASVNHQHFQGFIDERPLPVEVIGAEDYPLELSLCEDMASAWQRIDSCLQRDIAFNCIYRRGRCYILPRRYQGEVALPGWLQGTGWSDLAGLFMVPDQSVLHGLDDAGITGVFESLRC